MRNWRNRCRIWWEETKGEEKSRTQKLLLLFSVFILGICALYQGPAVLKTLSPSVEMEQSSGMPLMKLEEGDGDKRLVLSFDCEGEGNHVEEILRILQANHVPAVFFATGEWLDKNGKEAEMIAAQGYEIGGHGVKHEDLFEADYETCLEELRRMDEKISRVTGKRMRLYRPAYNSFSNTLLQCAADCDVTVVLYSLDSEDWKNYGASELTERVSQSDNLQDGAILWCHLNGKYTAQSLNTLIGTLEEKGYRFVGIP